MARVDCIIVGQGIAGTLLARQLLRKGLSVRIFDAGHAQASSMVAAGIVNPITGRNFVRSWRVHEFIPFALDDYAAIEEELGVPVHRMSHILRSITSVEEENSWHARTADPLVSQYMLDTYSLSGYKDIVRPAFSYGELTGTFQVFMPTIITEYASRWKQQGVLVEAMFDYTALEIDGNGFQYRGIAAQRIIFCEGYQAQSNPFFPAAGLAPTKGEALTIELDHPLPDKMYKDGIFLVPLPSGAIWVGGGYAWNTPDCLPTAEGRRHLEQELKRILKIPFTILDHKAAIRPTMQRRRPVLLAHDLYKGMFLFNGLGTKGASMGPLLAFEAANHITGPASVTSLIY